MKKLSILGLLLLAVIGFNSCSSNDDVVFVTNNNSDLTFSNTFSSEYILLPQASSNLAERFTWNSITTDVPTNVTYTLEKSITGDFSDADVVGATTGNEIAITIGDMLGYANEAGLDSDPNTDAPNTGNVSFRLIATLGDGGLPNTSDVQTLVMVMEEVSGPAEAVCDLDGYYMVGAGVTFTGWDWATPQFAACSGTNVYTVNVDLTNNVDGDGNFRFFTANNNWDSGINYPSFIDEGYTIDDRFEDAMDGDNNFLFTGDTGKYLLTIDAVGKTITLSDPAPLATCEFDQMWGVGAGLVDTGWDWAAPQQLMCDGDGVYSGWVNYTSVADGNNFRFFTANNNWDSGLNYPYFEGEGYVIDEKLENAEDGDSNFAFIGTDGAYFTIIDTVNKTITLQ